MTPEEAIESLKDDLMDNPLMPGCRLEKAKKLGIEALKREKAHRERYSMRDPELLPGETEE